MFSSPPAQPLPKPLPPALLADDATAEEHARNLQPLAVAADRTSQHPAIVCAWVLGPAVFVRSLIRDDLAPAERELAAEAVRLRIVGLLRRGTGDGGWRWDPVREQWTAIVDDLAVALPDHVPADWVRRAA
jgi:hypothetical protein